MVKKILYIVFEPHFSGQGRAVEDLVNNIGNQFTPYIICQRSNNKFASLVESDFHLQCNISKVINFEIIKAIKFAKKKNINLIHLHGFEGLIWGHTLAILTGIPIVFTPHTIDMKNQLLYFFYKNAWRLLTNLKTSKLITVSYNDKAILIKRKLTRADKITPILLGVKKEKYNIVKLIKYSELDLNRYDLTVIQVGHLSFQKNPFCYIKAAEKLIRAGKNILFLHAGSGEMASEINNYLKKNDLSENIKMLGFRSDALSIMSITDVVVNTSNWEGMPFTLIDAAFLGKAVIATNVNGNVDLIKHNVSGLIFNKGDILGLVKQLKYFLNHKSDITKYGKNLKESVSGKFETSTMISKHLNLYQEFI